MKQQDHLQVFDLLLRVQSPLFVGSGTTYLPKEYNFNPKSQIVSIYDEKKFSAFLAQRGLMDKYIGFILDPDPNRKDLYKFLTQECGLAKEQKALKDIECYRLSAADVADASPCEIHAFQRDADGRPYLPGSSVKGALRTAWLTSKVLAESPARHSTADFWKVGSKPGNGDPVFPENHYLNLLTLYKEQEDAVNDLFRGIQVSDSNPGSSVLKKDQLVLCTKWDADPNGQLPARPIPVWRECVPTGTSIWCKLTLDQSVLKGRITKESLEEAIRQYSAYYRSFCAAHFTPPRNAAVLPEAPCLILGGGTGFVAKTLVYPYLGEEKGLAWAIDRLNQKAAPHHHEKDRALGAAPRTMKYTFYRGKYYPYGYCEVTIQ